VCKNDLDDRSAVFMELTFVDVWTVDALVDKQLLVKLHKKCLRMSSHVEVVT